MGVVNDRVKMVAAMIVEKVSIRVITVLFFIYNVNCGRGWIGLRVLLWYLGVSCFAVLITRGKGGGSSDEVE